jgi:hypothetical protein
LGGTDNLDGAGIPHFVRDDSVGIGARARRKSKNICQSKWQQRHSKKKGYGNVDGKSNDAGRNNRVGKSKNEGRARTRQEQERGKNKSEARARARQEQERGRKRHEHTRRPHECGRIENESLDRIGLVQGSLLAVALMI